MEDVVLISDKVRKNREEMIVDPIIDDMLQELHLAGYTAEELYASDEYNFMTRASQTYHEYGGTKALTIGCPAEALVALERNIRNALEQLTEQDIG